LGDRDNKNDKHENDQIEAREQIMVAETTFDATQEICCGRSARGRSSFLTSNEDGYGTTFTATILISSGGRWQDDVVRQKIRQWYWCGVLGEQYGSTVESRFARDLPEVIAWALEDGPVPQTIQDCNFVTDRLMSLRSRPSAAYKGLHALIMQSGGLVDWTTGAGTDEQTYFDESIDIHYIFLRAWCDHRKINGSIYNFILNKTALSARTNRFLGGDAHDLSSTPAGASAHHTGTYRRFPAHPFYRTRYDPIR
jgi:hypothetical protein